MGRIPAVWQRHQGDFDSEVYCDDGGGGGEGGIDEIGINLIHDHLGKLAILVGASTTFVLALIVVFTCVQTTDGNFRTYSALSWANGYMSYYVGVVLLTMLALLATCVAFALAWSAWSEATQHVRAFNCAAMTLGILILKISVALLLARSWSRKIVIQSTNAICLNAASYQSSWGCVEERQLSTSSFDLGTDAKAHAVRVTSPYDVVAIFLEEVPESSRCRMIQNLCASSPAGIDPAFACVCSQAQTAVASALTHNTIAPQAISLFNWPGKLQLRNTKILSPSSTTSTFSTTATHTNTRIAHQSTEVDDGDALFDDDDKDDDDDDDDDDQSVRRRRVSTSRDDRVGPEPPTMSPSSSTSTLTTTETMNLCQSNDDCPMLYTCVARPTSDFARYVQTCEQISDETSDETTSANTNPTTTPVLCTSNAECTSLGGLCVSACANISAHGCAEYVQYCKQFRRLQAFADHTYCSDWDGPGTSQWCAVLPGCTCGATLVDGLWRSSGPCTDSVESRSAALLDSMVALGQVVVWSVILSVSLFLTAGCGRWMSTMGHDAMRILVSGMVPISGGEKTVASYSYVAVPCET